MTATAQPAAVVPSASSPGYIPFVQATERVETGVERAEWSGRSYYNEHDKRAAAWLRNLISEGLIAPGDVDERSIAEVQPHELNGYTQCHFFAGIGGWSLALRLAGWPDGAAVWTGSCPCQPFSAAGAQRGTADERHLWPEFLRLIAERQPATVFGEQVASALGRGWLAGVRSDLEAVGYAVGAADLCAAGVGAPHIRQRLYWLAHSASARRNGTVSGTESEARDEARLLVPRAGGAARSVADTDGGNAGAEGLQRSGQHGQRAEDCGAGRMEHAARNGREQRRPEPSGRSLVSGCGAGGMGDAEGEGRAGVVAECETELGFRARPWSTGTILRCTDGKARRVEPSAFPLVDGIPGCVGLLRGYGNAIVPQVAAEFIQASREALTLGGGGAERLGERAPTTRKECNDGTLRQNPAPSASDV